MIRRGSAFGTIFIGLALLLMISPFITALNSFLTGFFLKFGFYQALENFIVPYQAKAIASVLSLLPLKLSVYPVAKGVWLNGAFIEIQWNCLGWQSAVILLATLLTGFGGKFSWVSRAETVIIGFLGTYLINILRLIVISLLAVFIGGLPTILVHEYIFTLVIIGWFFVFWWFSYSFVLEERS